MKIAYLIPTFSPFGGSGRAVYMVATEQKEASNDVTIFALEADKRLTTNVAIEIMGMPHHPTVQVIYRLMMPLNIYKALKWVPKLKGFDVICSYHYPMSWLAYLAKRFYGVKFVYYNFGVNYPEQSPSFVERTYLRIFIALQNWTIRRADSAISISYYLQQQLKQETGLASEVAYPKSEATRFHEGLDGSRVRDKYNLGSSPLILYVGRIVPYKGLHLLIEAFNMVKLQFPSAKLVIVGKHIFPAYSKKLAEMADGSVIFAEYVSDEEAPYYYAACDIYATGEVWGGFNLPLVEAQACGKPVVAFNVGAHPEIVEDGEGGFLVPPEDVNALAEAIIRLLEDNKLRQEMGENACRAVRRKGFIK